MLRLHQRTVHYKIKPFVCDYCEYTASKKSTMNLHIRLHTGEKPFKCDTCDYRTSDHNSLRRHKITHSGEKPYKCPYCSYSCISVCILCLLLLNILHLLVCLKNYNVNQIIQFYIRSLSIFLHSFQFLLNL